MILQTTTAPIIQQALEPISNTVTIALIASLTSAFVALCGVFVSIWNNRKLTVMHTAVNGMKEQAEQRKYKEGVSDQMLDQVDPDKLKEVKKTV